MTPMLTTSLHLEIARLRQENVRLREQRDERLRQNVEGHPASSEVAVHPTTVRVFMDKADWDHEVSVAPASTGCSRPLQPSRNTLAMS
jgi:hypothetical protein